MNPTASGEAITGWLHPLRPVLDPDDRVDWTRLAALAGALDESMAVYPVGADLSVGAERSRQLRAVRGELAARGHVDTRDHLFQVFAQFVCGYRDIDLRDATGLGHGLLIARHGSPQARQQWVPRLLAGELVGIAVTEPHGGSRPAATRTVAGPDGTWLVTGRKTWISRLTEAAVFVVFFRAPDGRLAAAAVTRAIPACAARRFLPQGWRVGPGVFSTWMPCRSDRRTS